LLDMDIDPFNFADSLLAVLAQRLARTLCSKCKKEYHPEESEFNELRRMYGEDKFEDLGVTYDDSFMLYKADGCDNCSNTGYRGRIALHELLINSDDTKDMIIKRESINLVRDLAVSQGMTTLLQDGIQKVMHGFTDFKSVRSVCVR